MSLSVDIRRDLGSFCLDVHFTAGDGVWTLDKKDYILTVTRSDEEMETGTLRCFRIDGKGDGKDLFSLPSTRYVPKEVSP